MKINAFLLNMNNLVFHYCDANMTLPSFFKYYVIVLTTASVNACQILEFNLGLVPNLLKLFVWYGHPDKRVKLKEHLSFDYFASIKNDLSRLSGFLLFGSKKIGR